MEAPRKIVTIKDNLLQVTLPDNYNGKQVELIILPAQESVTGATNEKRDYSMFYGKLKNGLTETRVDDKLKSLREEWSRDLS